MTWTHVELLVKLLSLCPSNICTSKNNILNVKCCCSTVNAKKYNEDGVT